MQHLVAELVARTRLDLLDRAHLPGSHHLVLVEQEHRHAGSIDEFVDLGAFGAQIGLRLAVDRGLADAVGLVADQDV